MEILKRPKIICGETHVGQACAYTVHHHAVAQFNEYETQRWCVHGRVKLRRLICMNA